MASAKDITVKKARLFLDSLHQAGIDVSEAYLFGSAASGMFHEDSDIDLAVVSREFQGVRYHDMKKISKHRRKIDLRLEIHPFSRDQGWDKKGRCYDASHRVAVVYENFVVVINMSMKKNGTLKANFVTCYQADNSIGKIRNSPCWTRKACLDALK